MLKCWSSNSELRPTFQFLENFFGDDGPNFLALSPGRSGAGDRRRSSGAIPSPSSSTTNLIPPAISPPPPPLPRTPEPRRNLNNDNNVNANDISADVSLMSFD